jgi:hypothetical protein
MADTFCLVEEREGVFSIVDLLMILSHKSGYLDN